MVIERIRARKNLERISNLLGLEVRRALVFQETTEAGEETAGGEGGRGAENDLGSLLESLPGGGGSPGGGLKGGRLVWLEKLFGKEKDGDLQSVKVERMHP